MRVDARYPAAPLWAGFLYFLAVFAIGFVLGTVRTLAVEAGLGIERLLAVLIELPVMLGASWLVAGFLVRRLAEGTGLLPRIAMGGCAFMLLMAAEAGLSVVLMGRTLQAHVSLYAEASHALGLLGQVCFALIPALHPVRATA
ncbi:MAG: hypothetical protein ACK6DM_09625 [Alphaproteobacteria bacterium]